MVDQDADSEPTSSYEAIADTEDGGMEAVGATEVDVEEGGGQGEEALGVLGVSSDSTFFGSHSLASAPTTPCLAKYIIPLLALVAHGIFLYGQTAPMWRLSLAAEDISVYANATTESSRLAFDTLGWDHHLHYTMEKNHTIQTFTYGFAVQELWEAKGMPGVFMPRLGAILLILFSGIWPHVKLVWLNATWFRSTIPLKRRSTTLNWLANLGKWSLADVLTVCVMVGVLNLEWIIDPPLIKDKVMSHLSTIMDLVNTSYNKDQICDYFLHKDCSKVSKIKDKVKCSACKTFVAKALKDPDWLKKHGEPIVDGVTTNGGGHVQLSVIGLPGIYFFCGAVILSVLLSVLVDMYHLRDLEMKRHHLNQREEPTGPTEDEMSSIPTRSVHSASGDEISEASEPLIRTSSRIESMEFDEGSMFSHPVVAQTTSFFSQIKHCVHIPSFLTLLVVAFAVYTPSMKREVDGAIPMLLKDILNVKFSKLYSLQTLCDTTGAAGGMDLMLMGTFSIFCVAGPLLRAVLIVILHMLQFKANPEHIRIRLLLSKAVLFLGAFCAWEVFLVAIAMVELLMPSITDTILNTPLCKHVAQDGQHGSCLQVAFTRTHVFYAIVAGFVFLVTMTQYQQFVMKQERIPPGAIPYIFLDNNNTSGDDQEDIGEEDHPLRLQEHPRSETVQDPRQRLVGLAAAMEEDSRHGWEREAQAETEIV